MAKKKKSTLFKDEYVLASGYPWVLGNGPMHSEIMMCKNVIGCSRIYFKFPFELWEKSIPQYELVLRKIKKGRVK